MSEIKVDYCRDVNFSNHKDGDVCPFYVWMESSDDPSTFDNCVLNYRFEKEDFKENCPLKSGKVTINLKK